MDVYERMIKVAAVFPAHLQSAYDRIHEAEQQLAAARRVAAVAKTKHHRSVVAMHDAVLALKALPRSRRTSACREGNEVSRCKQACRRSLIDYEMTLVARGRAERTLAEADAMLSAMLTRQAA